MKKKRKKYRYRERKLIKSGAILKKCTKERERGIKKKTKKEEKMTLKTGIRYEEEFKKSLAALYHNGKSQSQHHREYSISASALGNG